MGLCESKNNQLNYQLRNKRNQIISDDNYDLEETKQIFLKYIFEDDIKDYLEKKYNLNDPIFQLIRKEELSILTDFYKKNKEDFKKI